MTALPAAVIVPVHHDSWVHLTKAAPTWNTPSARSA
jgi:hypothetical protein